MVGKQHNSRTLSLSRNPHEQNRRIAFFAKKYILDESRSPRHHGSLLPLNFSEAFTKMSEATVVNNQKHILKNQKMILSNQAHIKTNQETIKKNQAVILKNQQSLNAILKNQKTILAHLKK
jgi:hypothetical protein